MREKNVQEELINVEKNAPLFPGDTISHDTANECFKRGWVVRDENGNWILTPKGKEIAAKIR